MTEFWFGILLGCWLGASFGALMMGICTMARDRDEITADNPWLQWTGFRDDRIPRDEYQDR